jgi:uncharacterized tellurite resistance protein B-like protein
MHVILGALGLLVTILFLLSRLADAGIDLGGLNPFLWKRRRAWRRKVEGNPIFTLRDPLELAALLVAATAKIDGDMSSEEKKVVLREFEHTLGLKHRTATDLLGSSAYLLGDTRLFQEQLDAFLANAKERLSPAQATSVIAMMESVAGASGTPSESQKRLIATTRERLEPAPEPIGTWV